MGTQNLVALARVTVVMASAAALVIASLALQLGHAAEGGAASPPLIVRLDQAGLARTPDGLAIALPAGTEIDACGTKPLRYELPTRVVHVVEPCVGIFQDGFEPR